MKTMKWNIIALAVAAATTTQLSQAGQADATGFVEGSQANLLLRNAYFDRDYRNGGKDKAEWGQGFIGTFESGFTKGTFGVGVDAFGLLGIKLDTGRGRSNSGIRFFGVDSDNRAVDDIAKVGAAIKVRYSDTVIKYGQQMPTLPVLYADPTRLLPQSYTGTLLTSNEIDGLTVHAGRFTADSEKHQNARDSHRLDRIDVFGGRYQFNENLGAALYYADNEDVAKKKYANINVQQPLAGDQSVGLDFNIYKSDYDRKWTGSTNQDNTIWSLAATYATGAHAFILAHQRNSGDRGYDYGEGVGDGGGSINLANSFLSDFNYKNERSWQASYELNFATYGVPGLKYKTAYIRGTHIDTGATNSGKERELFNQVSYTFQDGAAKDLSLRLRNSILRADNLVREDVQEIRVFVEYPLNLL